MVHSKLPVLPLLCLLWALPMPGVLSKAPSTDPGVQKALAFAVEQYNQGKSSNYFKHVGRQQARKEVANGIEYHLTVGMVITVCKKKIGETMTYRKIQQCKEFIGNMKETMCYFKVIVRPVSKEMKLADTDCENN